MFRPAESQEREKGIVYAEISLTEVNVPDALRDGTMDRRAVVASM
jgi:hypothetical protein